MTINVRSKVVDHLPICVREIRVDRFIEQSLPEIARQKIQHGNRPVEFGELFHVSRTSGSADIVWQGDLKSVNGVGFRMKHGNMLVEGNPGRHLGSEMSGGEIVVAGDTGDFLGVQMHGGIIRVQGNAGDFVGSHYAGEKFGVNRGTILIDGDAGRAVGSRMRRGLIAVHGNVDQGLGWNMLAGNLVVFGSSQQSVGSNMKRGTIVLAGEESPLAQLRSAANFRYSGTYATGVLGLISAWLKKIGFNFPEDVLTSHAFDHFAGDRLNGGRGEIFVSV